MFEERTVLQTIVKYGTCKDEDSFILCDLCPYNNKEDDFCSIKREALKSVAEQKLKELDNKFIQPSNPCVETENPLLKEVWFFYYNAEEITFNGDWSITTRRSSYYPSFEEAWKAKETKKSTHNSSCKQILGPILKGYIKEN